MFKNTKEINPTKLFDHAQKYVNNNSNIYSFSDKSGKKKTILDYSVTTIPKAVQKAFKEQL